jgi:hypothetical protein
MIIICVHNKKTKIVPKNNWIKPISCGDLDFEDDELLSGKSKDNINHLNSVYAELTSHYWMWKNILHEDYYGLCHYRRYLNFTNEKINNLYDLVKESQKETAYNIIKNYDIILPEPIAFSVNIEQQYKQCKPAIHWDLYIEIICSLYPKYIKNIDFFTRTNFLHPCNIFLSNKEIFNDYSKELFNISNIFYKNLTYPENQPDNRYVGYLSERFLNLYVYTNKIKHTQVKIIITDQ